MGPPCLTHDCFWCPIYSNCLVQCATATHNTGWREGIAKYLDLFSFPLVGFFCLSLLRSCRISPRTAIDRHCKAIAPALKQRQLGADASEERSHSRELPSVLSSCPLPQFSHAASGLWIFFVFSSCGCQYGFVESYMPGGLVLLLSWTSFLSSKSEHLLVHLCVVLSADATGTS